MIVALARWWLDLTWSLWMEAGLCVAMAYLLQEDYRGNHRGSRRDDD